jgi:hypothetical protein
VIFARLLDLEHKKETFLSTSSQNDVGQLAPAIMKRLTVLV